ncbi:unnamed protein product [Meloidogyne enterolobii]|uniref:Uncharacterized protein n=1 Tax=Meloidogyne enterolobii TaxID=390850 RepID=A0ACB0XU85_MELEN
MGGSSRHKGEGSSHTKQYHQKYGNKINKKLDLLKEKNGCTGHEKREINPNRKTQKELIDYYLENHETFRYASEQAKNKNIKQFFDRFENEEYEVNN